MNEITQEEWDAMEAEALQLCIDIVASLPEEERESLNEWANKVLANPDFIDLSPLIPYIQHIDQECSG